MWSNSFFHDWILIWKALIQLLNMLCFYVIFQITRIMLPKDFWFHGTICDYKKDLTLKPLIILQKLKFPRLSELQFSSSIFTGTVKNNSVNLNTARGDHECLFIYTGKNSTQGTIIKPEEIVIFVACHFFLVLPQEQMEHWNAWPQDNGAQPRTSLLGHSLVVSFQAWFA